MSRYGVGVCFLVSALLLFASPSFAQRKLRISKGQKVFVPVYSHVYQGPKNRPYNLAVMLSIRNVESKKAITVTSVEYFNDHGELKQSFLKAPVHIPPMGTKEVFIPERDKTGGSGANFIVKWKAAKRVSAPIIQALMIGTASTQGISFVCRGIPVFEEE